MKHAVSITLLLTLSFCCGCHEDPREKSRTVSLDDFKAWNVEAYTLYSGRIRNEIARLSRQEDTGMYADAFTKRYYDNRRPFVWIDRWGADARADSLLEWLGQAPEIGLKASSFHVDELTADLHKLRTLQGAADEGINTVMARVEYRLTQAYLRYVCGQRFGFVNPQTSFNRLERTDTTPNAAYRRLFDIPCEAATDSFVNQALQEAREGHIGEFLADIQPSTALYHKLLRAYQEHRTEKEYAEKLLVNLERSRWRIPQPSGKYVWVNLAGFTLTAADEAGDSVLTMRVCGGDREHKTPLLYSFVQWVELNPYWVIPTSIIKREIAPRYAGSTDYFERNRIRIINKETKQEMDPAQVSAAMLRSGKYTLRQDKGDGNSLGRLVFRFPNNFAVFLHDTNNRAAFKRKSRAISHGCIRLERPLDLAIFLMDEPKPNVIDRMRIAIDLPPLTDYGRRLLEDPDYKKMSVYHFSPAIPLFLQYFTVYPNPDGELETFPDPYGYDDVLKKKLNAF